MCLPLMNASKPQTAKGSKRYLLAKFFKISIQDQEPQDSLKLTKKRFRDMTDPEFILLGGHDIRHREQQYLAEQCNIRILGRLEFEPITHCPLLHCASLCLCRAALTVQAGSSEAEERGQGKITGNTW